MTTHYTALIADVAASRALAPPARARLQARIRDAARELNARYRPHLAARFAVTLGDELQGLFKTATPVWEVSHRLRLAFPDVDWVVACGRGTLSTPLRRGATAPELDGPCFHAARAALDRAKRHRLVLAFEGFDPSLAACADYYSALYWGWTRRQRAVVIAWLTRDVAHPTRAGMFWGRLALFAAGYWYACAGGAVLIRRVLDLVPVGESPGKGGITVPASELSRGMVIGVLERAITLTLVFIGQFGALGLVLAAKALTRFRALDDRDFAEYVLIGTLASILFALLVGIALRFVMFWG